MQRYRRLTAKIALFVALDLAITAGLTTLGIQHFGGKTSDAAPVCQGG
jgi:hypothetical protein